MLANVGRIDRTLRLAAGAGLVLLAAWNSSYAWGWLGLLPLLSGLVRHCPLYALLGLSTCGGDI